LAGESERPLKIFRDIGLIGINKGQIEWSAALRGEFRQRVQCSTEANIHYLPQAGTRDISSGYLGMFRIRFECNEPASGWERPRHPDCAVARQRAKLKNCASAYGLRQKKEQLSLAWRNSDGRK